MAKTLAVQEQRQILNPRARINGPLVIPASEGAGRAPESKPVTKTIYKQALGSNEKPCLSE